MKPKLLDMIPGSGWLGEETASVEGVRYIWLCDPTDGTAVRSRNGEYYSNVVALIDREGNEGDGEVRLISIYQPIRERLFRSVDGGEARIIERVFTDKLGGFNTIDRLPKGSKSLGFGEWFGCSFGTSKHYKAHPGIKERLERVFEASEDPELKRKYAPINARPYSGSSAMFCCDIADGQRHFAFLFFQKAWDLTGALYAADSGCPVVVFDNQGDISGDAWDLEKTIAHCTKSSLVNVGVFANETVKDVMMQRFNY